MSYNLDSKIEIMYNERIDFENHPCNKGIDFAVSDWLFNESDFYYILDYTNNKFNIYLLQSVKNV